MTRFRFWALPALILLLTVAGCRREEPVPVERAPDDPVAAVEAQVQALRNDDLRLWGKLALPPDLYARAARQWTQRQAEAGPPSAEDAEEYATMMARLTAPDAETALMRDLEVKLKEFEAEVGDQWPLMQAALGMFVQAAIEANTELDGAGKAHASGVASGLVQWLQPALITDRARARQAVAEVAATARALDLPTLDDARALSMEEAMDKGGIVLAGLKRVARIYDLDLDAALDGVEARALSVDGDRAVVKVEYPLFGRTMSMEMPMVRRDGGWYGESAVRDAETGDDTPAGDDAPADAGVPALEAGEVPDVETAPAT